MLLRLAILLPVIVAAGCSCNELDVDFPRLGPVSDEGAPEDYGAWLTMDVAPDGERLTMGYHDTDWGAVGFAVGTVRADGTLEWRHERVDGYPASDGLDPGNRGKYISHRVSPDGTVWIAYSDHEKAGLYVSHRESGPGSWTEGELVEIGAGAWTSLAVDADGNPVIAHVDGLGATALITRWDGAAWTTSEVYSSTSVTIEPEDTGSEPIVRPAKVEHTTMAIKDGIEFLALRDAASGDLLLFEGAGDAWTKTVVDQGDTGLWPSIAFGSDTVLIAYQDVANQDLELATRVGGAGFTSEAVDTGAYRGADTAMILVDGEPVIAYFDGWENDLRLASRRAGGWSLDKVGGEGTALGFHNEIQRVGDTTWIGSYDLTTRRLVFARVGAAATDADE